MNKHPLASPGIHFTDRTDTINLFAISSRVGLFVQIDNVLNGEPSADAQRKQPEQDQQDILEQHVIGDAMLIGMQHTDLNHSGKDEAEHRQTQCADQADEQGQIGNGQRQDNWT